MPDYQEMYQSMFRAMTKAITILQEAQQRSEELYMADESPDICLKSAIPPEHSASKKESPRRKRGKAVHLI